MLCTKLSVNTSMYLYRLGCNPLVGSTTQKIIDEVQLQGWNAVNGL